MIDAAFPSVTVAQKAGRYVSHRSRSLVTALNECGESPESESDRGHRGETVSFAPDKTFETVLPAKASSECGPLTAKSNDTISIRLVAADAIDEAEIWGTLKAANQPAYDLHWIPLNDSGSDGWLVFEAAEPFLPGDMITVVAGAKTISGQDVEPVSRELEIAPEVPKKDLRAVVQPIQANDSQEEAQIFIAASGAVPPLENAVGPACEIAAALPFETPARAWLPVPPNYHPEQLVLYYYHAVDNDSGWYLADNVDGFLMPDGYRLLEQNGQVYIGVLVRHGGLVQLAAPLDEYPKQQAGAVFSLGFSQNGLNEFLLPLVCALLILGWARETRKKTTK